MLGLFAQPPIAQLFPSIVTSSVKISTSLPGEQKILGYASEEQSQLQPIKYAEGIRVIRIKAIIISKVIATLRFHSNTFRYAIICNNIYQQYE
ncbi:hypothetical protein FGO68_gene14822 [Halteria grandinella]|uniref:Uncharacterized protein n=1 Tax=Halteria grandinella TaxID=5974 RepID=A0A8J8P6J3_HALGN|nr:hypothetical protein FGO68_gene14822 [Halteria grandinella]